MRKKYPNRSGIYSKKEKKIKKEKKPYSGRIRKPKICSTVCVSAALLQRSLVLVSVVLVL